MPGEQLTIEDLLPLTPAQTGILFESISNPDPELYYEQVRFDLVGPLDLDRFRAAWDAAHARHDALRTVFCWDGLDEPVAVVQPIEPLGSQRWQVADLRSIDSPDDPLVNGRRLDELAAALRAEGIDVQHGPLSRFDLFRVAADRVHVIWGFHHLLLDGWSTAQVVGEVLADYDSADTVDRARATSPRPYLEWLADQDDPAARAYWRSLLNDVDEPTLLGASLGPAAIVNDAAGSFQRARIDAALTAEQASTVRAAASRQRVTVNTMMQAAWARTLSRWTDTDRVTFGVTISGRPPELDGSADMVGMFLNTVPFPVTVPQSSAASPADADIGEWLRTIQGQQLDVSANGYASLAAVQRLATTDAGTLFDSILVFENYPMRRDDHESAVAVEHYGVFEQTHYPLAIMAGDTDTPELRSSLGCIVIHDENVIAPWLAQQLVDDFLAELVSLSQSVLSTSVLSKSALSQSALSPSVLPQSVRSRSVEAARAATAPAAVVSGPSDLADSISESLARATVAGAFTHRAQLNANDVAVRCNGETLTFAELDRRASAVAAALQQRGVGPEVPVGVAIERSIDQVVAIVGIVLAGGCYLPLDPGNPPDRLSSILDDAGASLVVAAGPNAGSPTRPASVFGKRSMTDLAALLAEVDPDARPEPVELDPMATLFLTFTSGSTGRPKGVPVHHRGVLHRLAWQYLTHPPAPNEVGVAKTTLGFVDHLSELWGPLLAGQSVVLAPDDVVKDVPQFIELCAEAGIRRLVVVPSYLEALLESAPDLGAEIPTLELLTTSGEALSPVLAARAARALPGVTLLNIYGMSEATADVTVTELAPAAAGAGSVEAGATGVGLPLPGLTVAVTDRHGVPLPRGAIGSIDVSGVALSAGYWQRPDLTAASFVERDGTRWYRTGDRGWLGPTGELHVVGRADRQVKIRGMRVELGEIESVMERHPSVDRCAVAHRVTGDLVAFVVGEASPADCFAHARSTLPGHMVPTAFENLPELPATHNGKLDRAALDRRALDVRIGDPDHEAAATTPSSGVALSPAEQRMVELWRSVLPDADIGPTTDFFDAGGHSLLALRLMNRINATFDTNLSLAQILEAPTPRTLAALVSPTEANQSSSMSPSTSAAHEFLVPILADSPVAAGARRTLFCVHGAGGNVLNFRALGKAIESDFELVGIQARGVDGVAEPHPDMASLVVDYVAVIRARQLHGPYLLAGYSGGGTIAVEIARALEADGADVEATLLLDTFHNEARPLPFSRAEHLRQLRSQGPRYLVDRVKEKVLPGENEQHAEIVAAARAEGRPIPLDSREWFLKGALYELIGSHPIRPYDGTVVLLAATDTHPGLVHMGHDHGLAKVFSHLEIIDVEGDHHSLVEGHNAPELGRLILDRLVPNRPTLDRPTLDRLTLDSEDRHPRGDSTSDAQQHVYRHLPSGLDESPLLRRYVEPGSAVLDVGTAATGRSALALQALGAQVTSIEYNHAAIAEFASGTDTDQQAAAAAAIALTTADMADLPFADASFDAVVVAFHGFDYLVDPAVRTKAVAELGRVLRPGGRLIVNSYNTLGILTDPTTARSVSNWKRRLRFVFSGEASSRRLVDGNGLALHHGRPGQLIEEFERTGSLRFETITPLNGGERSALLVKALAPEPNYVFTRI